LTFSRKNRNLLHAPQGEAVQNMLSQYLHKRAPFVFSVAGPALLAAVYLYLFGSYISRRLYRSDLIFEFGLLIYFSLVMIMFQRRKLVGAGLTSVALLSLYTAFFGKYIILHAPLTFFDVLALDELVYTLPSWSLMVIGAAFAGFCFLFIKNLTGPTLTWTWLVLAPPLGYAISVLLFPQTVVAVLNRARPPEQMRRDLDFIRNGPLFSLARGVAEAMNMRRFLDQPADPLTPPNAPPTTSLLASLDLKERPNVHVILLESFIDPLNFTSARLPLDPINRRFRRWMNETRSVALSPVFGGSSAQAEVEILCGVPSYGMFGVEFNHFGGGRMQCLPAILRSLGYTAVASVPVPMQFFNCGRAYASVGFDRGHFAEDFAFTDMDGPWLSSAAVFRQVLQFVEPELTNGTPLFNYIVTASGHFPFRLNPTARPPVFPGNSLIEKVANAVYYNSAAVADFIEKLEKRDPKVIIVILGDHLPPSGPEDALYRRGDYHLRDIKRNRPRFWEVDRLSALESRGTVLVARKARRSVPLGVISHFSLPEIILDLVSDGSYCQRHDCMNRRRVIYRPNGLHPVFTTTTDFPDTVCGAGQPNHDAECQAAQHQHLAMLQGYKRLMREGVQPSQSAIHWMSGPEKRGWSRMERITRRWGPRR